MKYLFLPLILVVSACSTSQSSAYRDVKVTPSVAANVDVLYAEPKRSFKSIGTVSARHYQPGFVDPTITDARAAIQKSGAEIGADAVIVRSSQAAPQTRLITVEGEAIKYN
ncbi:hypothetical protein [Ensifer adhaerens]|uniref:hypothetical protein n=1 Tax=Ensifer adhaerens TaxID=106592 RepID=UPI00132F3828|nr:hypothetical protein [Ensifer adhaerens]QHG70178.1 hypothetical protein DQW09_10115 [Ensifer adhaerens]